jgi:hypothetical protein
MSNLRAIRLAIALILASGAAVLLIVALGSESPGCSGEDRRILFGLAAAATAAAGVGLVARHRMRRWVYVGGAFLLVFVPVWLSSLNLCAS